MPNETVAVPTTPEGVLRRAADYMDEHGWTTEEFEDADGGGVCLLGGCLAALELPFAVADEDDASPLFWEAAELLAAHLGAPYGLRRGVEVIHEVGGWNDSECESKEQAVSVLRAAAGGCKEAPGAA